MTIQWSRELLERHVAPGIYDFDRAEIPELPSDIIASRSWMVDHFLNNVFRGQYKDPVREQVVNCVYRAEIAIKAYQEAKSRTASYLDKSSKGSPAIALYFDALSTWEKCFLNWQILVEMYRKLASERAFSKNDGSIDQRVYDITNSIKHFGDEKSTIDTHTLPMWLTNNGFQTGKHQVTYNELAQLMTEAGEFVKQIIDPKMTTSGE